MSPLACPDPSARCRSVILVGFTQRREDTKWLGGTALGRANKQRQRNAFLARLREIFLSYQALIDVRLATASVAVHIVEHRAEHPILRLDVPHGPRIAHHVGGAAFLADHPQLGFFLWLRHSRMMPNDGREGSVG